MSSSAAPAQQQIIEAGSSEARNQKSLQGHGRFTRVVAYLYLRRIPILIGTTMVLFPVVALAPGSPGTALLQNLFYLPAWGEFWLTIVSLLACWSVLLTSRLVLLNGEERFGVRQKYTAEELAKLKRSFWIVLLALPNILGPFTQKHDFGYSWGDLGWRLFAAAAGFVCAYLIMFAALFMAVLIAPKDTQSSALSFPCFKFMRHWLNWANDHGLIPSRAQQAGLWIREHLPPALWAGYISKEGFLWGGQWLAFLFSVATLIVYFFIDELTRALSGESTVIPALVFVLLLLVNINWIFSALAFFLDRFRIPLLIPVVLVCAVDAVIPASDHYYTVQRGVTLESVHPADVLEARAKLNKPIVVIATAGGGIQAAAWTTQVLAGLQEESQQWRGGRFSDSVTLISSVSGGATGAMFYLNLYHPTEREPFDEDGLKNLVAQSSASSLNEVAWALVYHDLPKIFSAAVDPGQGTVFDRGYMLEESWRNRGNIQANLSNWRLGVAQGLRPVAIFNGTINETGEPLVMATTDMQTAGSPARRTFYELYPDSDLPVVTAVRLGATFPYVTPSARALSTKPEYHVIDGGYYDNYGVSSAIAWLDEGFNDLITKGESIPDVLIIQIRSFPDDALTQPTSQGWFFQSYAPVEGLLNARATAQLIRDREDLEDFARRWEKNPAAREKNESLYGAASRIHFATFEFQGHKAPLSWAMNPRQITEVSAKWADLVHGNEPDLLIVHCYFDPAFPGCQKLQKGPW